MMILSVGQGEIVLWGKQKAKYQGTVVRDITREAKSEIGPFRDLGLGIILLPQL